MAKQIEVIAVTTGIVGEGQNAHRVRPGTVFTIEEGSVARSWFVPTDPSVKLPLPERRSRRRDLAAQEFEAAQREARKKTPTTFSEMTKATPAVAEKAPASRAKLNTSLME